MMIRAFASTTKVHKFAKSRQRSFFWSGKIGYFHEMYLNLSIGIGFNLGAMSLETAELGFNTFFFVYIGVNAILIPLLPSIFLYRKLKKATLDEQDIKILQQLNQT